MSIDKKTVMRTAELSRLKFTDSEVDTLISEFEVILRHAKNVNAIDTSGAVPSVSAFDKTNAFREDTPASSMENSQLLKSAPSEYDGAYIVPRVIE